ncbi:unnamed protein product [Ascophyllum nodosum]
MRSGNRCGSEDAREQGATPMTSNQQLQAQDPTPQRDRGIMPRTINRAQGWEARPEMQALIRSWPSDGGGQFGYILPSALTSGGGDGKSASPAAIFL